MRPIPTAVTQSVSARIQDKTCPFSSILRIMTVEHVSTAKSCDELLRTLREKTFLGAPFEPHPGCCSPPPYSGFGTASPVSTGHLTLKPEKTTAKMQMAELSRLCEE
jgi:hypothetical protein